MPCDVYSSPPLLFSLQCDHPPPLPCCSPLPCCGGVTTYPPLPTGRPPSEDLNAPPDTNSISRRDSGISPDVLGKPSSDTLPSVLPVDPSGLSEGAPMLLGPTPPPGPPKLEG